MGEYRPERQFVCLTQCFEINKYINKYFKDISPKKIINFLASLKELKDVETLSGQSPTPVF